MMTPQQTAHLVNIQNSFIEAVRDKYRKGVEEHGGNLWEKTNLIDEAMNECIDLYVYLYTLREQLKGLCDVINK